MTVPQFVLARYSDAYYYRHFTQYRGYENTIGKHLVNKFSPKSILDLGCGVGSFLEGAVSAGCQDITGVEISFDIAQKYFVEEIKLHIQKGDVTGDLFLGRTFDCVMSIEVGEHIEPSGTDGFIKNLTSLSERLIVLTAAPPGQRGTGHINCRDRSFWIGAIEAKGFSYDEKLTDEFAEECNKIGAPWFFPRNLMIFAKK